MAWTVETSCQGVSTFARACLWFTRVWKCTGDVASHCPPLAGGRGVDGHK